MALVEEGDDLVFRIVSISGAVEWVDGDAPPGLKRVTCLPTDSTVPAPSDPGTMLSFIGNGYLPLGMIKSR